MGVRLAAAMGNEVTAISTKQSKEEMALKMGAKHFIVSKVFRFSNAIFTYIRTLH